MLNTLLLARSLRIVTKISTAFLPLIVMAISNTPYANATTTVLRKSMRDQQLITKLDTSPVNVTSQQQADIKGINQTLTQYYRGANELNSERIGRAWISYSATKKASDRDLFGEIKANHIDTSVEVKNIELLSLSEHNATLEVEEVIRLKKSNRPRELQRLLKFTMVKINNSWKITGIDNMRKPILIGDIIKLDKK